MVKVDVVRQFLKHIPIEYEVLGSVLRDCKDEVKDIDILVDKKDIDFWKDMDMCVREVKMSGTEHTIVIFDFKHDFGRDEIPLDIFYCYPQEKACFKTYLAGNKIFNIVLRTFAKKKAYTLNQRCLVEREQNKEIYFNTEQELFNFLGLKFIPYKEREIKDFSAGYALLNKYRQQ